VYFNREVIIPAGMQIIDIIRGDLELIEAIAPEKLANYEKEKAFYEKCLPRYTPSQWTKIDRGPHQPRGDGWLITRKGDVYTCNHLSHNAAAVKLFGINGSTALKKLGVVFALVDGGEFFYSHVKMLTAEQLATIKKVANGLTTTYAPYIF
jgi:hypothetical protein